MRVFVPITVDDLALCMTGRWAPTDGYAVTARLLDISAHVDEELLVEQVRDVAAADSVLVLGASRRAVVAVDYPRADVVAVSGGHPAAVNVRGRVAPEAVACAFVDEEDAAVDGAAAAAGDADALMRLEERDLLWFDATELSAW